MNKGEKFQDKLNKLIAKKERLFKSKGYEHKGYCYFGDFYEFISEKYSGLREYVVDNFGWEEWFNTTERNELLAECGVVVQIDNENGSIIYYSKWIEKKKELSYKDFNKWVVDIIVTEHINRRNSCDYDDYEF